MCRTRRRSFLGSSALLTEAASSGWTGFTCGEGSHPASADRGGEGRVSFAASLHLPVGGGGGRLAPLFEHLSIHP